MVPNSKTSILCVHVCKMTHTPSTQLNRIENRKKKLIEFNRFFY